VVLLQASNRLWTNQSKGVSYYSSIHDSHRIFTSQGKWHQKCGGHKPCSCRIRTQVRLACGQALPQATPPTYLPWGGGLLLLPYTPIIVNFFKVYIYIYMGVNWFGVYVLQLPSLVTPTRQKTCEAFANLQRSIGEKAD
jgi:hypothetical protein